MEQKAKPIFTVGIPSDSAERIYDAQFSLQEGLPDYHVLAYPILKGKDPIFNAFYSSDLKDLHVEDIKSDILKLVKEK